MNLLNFNKGSSNRWKKKTPRIPLFISISLLFLLSFFYFSYTTFPKFLLPISRKSIKPQFPQCNPYKRADIFQESQKFLWYAPHSGFSNQLSELKNAMLIAAILNRTLIIPPVLDHHAVALGSCPKFRVSTPTEIRMAVWDHIIQLVQTRRYVSMADIVDISSLRSSILKTIDFRVFASLWCGLNLEYACYGSLCCGFSGVSRPFSGNFEQCGSLLAGLEGDIDRCVYAVEEDCRTTVWSYQQNNDGLLDAFQPDEQLKTKKKISYLRKRRDVYKALGPGSSAELATVLSFGSLFSAPYKSSELHIDIHEAPRDPHIQYLLQKIESLPFVPEIISAGKRFAENKIKAPFLCAQLRLLDGQFKNHWKATFRALKEKIDSLDMEKANNPIHIFVMTDLPKINWTGTYLGDLAKSDSYKFYNLQQDDELVVQTSERLIAAEHGLKSGFLPDFYDGSRRKKDCSHVLLPDVLLYIEEAICSCASLGFVGTAGSTIAESIELLRKNSICLKPGQFKL